MSRGTAKHGGARANSGGKRPGAGRPPRRGTPAKARITVPLDVTERDTLNERAAERGTTAAEAVRTAMRLDKLID